MPRPALKTSIPYFVADNCVHFRMCGDLISLEETDGRILALLKLLDGTRDVEQVHQELRQSYPDVTRDDVAEAVRDLDETGLLHDTDDTGEDFSADDRVRWSNNFGFFESYASLATSKYEFQRRIRDARVGVLGVGGIGSHVLIDLVAIGFTNIRIVDFDRVELSNFNRQILYGEPFLGRRKIDVAAEKAQALNSAVHIDPVELRLRSADDVYSVVHDLDAVISVVDRPKVHVVHWLNAGCTRAGTAFVTGGVDVQRAVHYTVVPGVSGCVECWYAQVRAEDPTSRMVRDVLDEIDRSGDAYGEDTAAFNGLVSVDAGYMVAELVRLVSRVTPPLSVGRVIGATFHDPRLREIESWQRQPQCPTCREVTARPGFAWLRENSNLLPF